MENTKTKIPRVHRTSTSLEDIAFLPNIHRDRPLLGRKTKIICTIGPATKPVETLCKMLKNGMNIARLNFSHGTHQYHSETIENIRKASEITNIPCAVLLDTKGPEIRTGMLKGGKPVDLKEGNQIKIHCGLPYDGFLGTSEEISVDHVGMHNVVERGTIIKIDDGLILIEVEKIDSKNAVLGRVLNNQELGERKGVNLPGIDTGLPAMTQKDEKDILFGIEQSVDIIAPSFINSANDIKKIKEILGEKGKKIKIISKIESVKGINNFEEILDESDGIMIARGDLGVEIPIEKVNMAQKTMIAKSNAVGKPVVTATQMLDSMIENPSPTRAEAADVANAVIDGSDCVMLSGESAKGKYPLEAVEMMAKICRRTEESLDFNVLFNRAVEISKQPIGINLRTESVTSASVKIANDVNASLIFALSDTGRTSNFVSKYSPVVPIICVTPNLLTQRQSLIKRGLWPICIDGNLNDEERYQKAKSIALKNKWCRNGDCVVVISGKKGITGSSHKLRVLDVN